MIDKLSVADMHTHSLHSHDSQCRIEDMCIAQKQRGTAIFAVTNHFDTYSYADYDIFTPIKKACEEIDRINATQAITVLKGIEISEGFWFPEIHKKALSGFDLDVIIGSVHCVKYKDLTIPYSQIDFSKLSGSEIDEYLSAYFDDVITMLHTGEQDILAHLTCPLRYIVGKFKRKVDLSKYTEKIKYILNFIIENKIALEVNTSSFELLGDFMPPRDIIKLYRDMGGYLITLGSDAHIPENASISFENAISTLKEIGFENIFYYKERKAYQITI